MQNYEDIVALIATLSVPGNVSERRVVWLGTKKVLGAARTSVGNLELFLVGAPVSATSTRLRDALEFGAWYREGVGQAAFEATRISLPAYPHFDEVAAFVCVELLRGGIEDDLREAFRAAEPILDLAIERIHLSDDALIGLLGELMVLDGILQRMPDDRILEVMQGWAGWKQSLRDLSLGSVGIEVKTTTRSTSTHKIQGVHQLTASSHGGGGREERLVVVSIGVKQSDDHSATVSVPQLVDRICVRLLSCGYVYARDEFVVHVSDYSAGTGLGYVHPEMADAPAFAKKFELSYARAYDMADEAILVLRPDDLGPYQHVEAGSVSFTITLPDKISGDINPVAGFNASLRSLLENW